MKRKYLAVVLGLALTLTSMNVAFAATDSTTETTTEAADTTDDSTSDDAAAADTDTAEEETVYGEVSKVADDSVTIKVGTLKEADAKDAGDEASENKDAKDDAKDTDSKDKDAKDDTTEDTDTVFVGFGFAACIPPQEAQEPYSMIAAAPLAASNRDSLNVRPPTVQ